MTEFSTISNLALVPFMCYSHPNGMPLGRSRVQKMTASTGHVLVSETLTWRKLGDFGHGMKSLFTTVIEVTWLVVWNMNFIFHILGISSSQLTNSIIFQRGGLNHQPSYSHVMPLLPFQSNTDPSLKSQHQLFAFGFKHELLYVFSISYMIYMGCHPNPIDELHHFSICFFNHQLTN